MQILVEGNLDVAIRSLKKALEKDGIFKSIRLREGFPNLSDRKRHKQLIALRRRTKLERRKAILRNGKESSYDYQFRKQDTQNRLFTIRRSIAPVGGNQDAVAF
jgi:ribosomal protein S21